MKKKLMNLVLLCAVLLFTISFSKTAYAAGTAKPDNVQREASYQVLALLGSDGSGGTPDHCGLFDGTQVDEWNTPRMMYWRNKDTFVEIDIKEACNIWRSGTSTWRSDTKPLTILKWDGSQYVDVTTTYPQTLTSITQARWEKTINNLQPGRYKFAFSAAYRIDSEWYLEATTNQVLAPVKPIAKVEDKQVSLSWDPVEGATGYNVKFATTAGGPYTTITTTNTTTYTHTGLTNGTTYYYVISAVSSLGESQDSNEVSATPKAEVIIGNAILIIYLDNGTTKEYSLSSVELEDFLTWYDNRSAGAARAYYIFTVKGTTAPFKSIKNYIPYNKILYFDVNEFGE